jgi:hypothetical protein
VGSQFLFFSVCRRENTASDFRPLRQHFDGMPRNLWVITVKPLLHCVDHPKSNPYRTGEAERDRSGDRLNLL